MDIYVVAAIAVPLLILAKRVAALPTAHQERHELASKCGFNPRFMAAELDQTESTAEGPSKCGFNPRYEAAVTATVQSSPTS